MERTATWNGLGAKVGRCKDIESVLQKSGLDYEVTKQQVYLPTGADSFMPVPNRFATVRQSDGKVYDVVSDRFEVIQNRDAFDFVNYMTDDIKFVTAGETESGMVWIIAKMAEVSILGDAFTPHIIFRNGFNGAVRINAAICPLRIACQNQFNFAFRETANKVSITHTPNAYNKLEDAKMSLKMCADYMEHLNIVAERYAGMHFDQFKVNAILNEMFPVNDTDISEYKRTILTDAKMRFMKAYEQEDNYNFRGTAWGIINAYTDFITHKEPRSKKATRFENNFMRSIDENMNRVLNIVDGFASVAI